MMIPTTFRDFCFCISVGLTIAIVILFGGEFASQVKWDCDPPVSIGFLATIERQTTSALITLDNGRQFVIYGNPDVTPRQLLNVKGDEVFEKKGGGCMGQFVSFGDKDYWYSVIH